MPWCYRSAACFRSTMRPAGTWSVRRATRCSLPPTHPIALAFPAASAIVHSPCGLARTWRPISSSARRQRDPGIERAAAGQRHDAAQPARGAAGKGGGGRFRNRGARARSAAHVAAIDAQGSVAPRQSAQARRMRARWSASRKRSRWRRRTNGASQNSPRIANLSPFHLCHVFRLMVGTSIYDYVLHERLAHSLDAVLDCGSDLTAIALDAGFASHSHFTARFRASLAARRPRSGAPRPPLGSPNCARS
jgi:hypothetical protein